MARVDSILSVLVHQGANELRLGTDREPKLLSHGTPKRLSLPVTSEETLRELLGEILDPKREQALRARGRVDSCNRRQAYARLRLSLLPAREGGPAAVVSARAGGGSQ